MRFLNYIFLFVSAIILSGCNTIGGFGQDLSETGKALDRAAFWSQNQIDSVTEDSDTSDASLQGDDTLPTDGSYDPLNNY